MKTFNGLPINWNDEHCLLTDVYSQGKLIAQQIKTKLVIDNSNPRNSVCYLYPPDEIYKDINVFEYEIKGVFKDTGGNDKGSLYISKGYHEGGSQKHLANCWNENLVKIHPKEILIKWSLGEESSETDTEITFNITNNKAIKPNSYTKIGPSSIEKKYVGSKITLNFKNGDCLVFDEYSKSKDISSSQTNGYFSSFVQTMKLIKKSNKDTFSINEEILRKMEYLLWYLSFATNQRTTWMQWSRRFGTEFIQYTRCNIVYPVKDSEIDNALIEDSLLQEFLQQCLDYLDAPDKISLYLPIIYLINSKEKTCEFKLLSLFMSLEVLLNLFAKSNNFSCLFEDEEWDNFYVHMKRAAEDFLALDTRKKELIISRLGNLNELSLKFIFEEFCKNKQVDLSDLWPIFDNKIKLPLYRIRNKLVHGEQLSNCNLDVAAGHLRWIVTRCILAQLNWQKNSDVDRENLSKITYYNWKEFAEAVNS